MVENATKKLGKDVKGMIEFKIYSFDRETTDKKKIKKEKIKILNYSIC